MVADSGSPRLSGGDILTVMLEESTQSSKQAKTNFGKNNTVDIGAPTLFGHTKDNLSASVDANRDFNGTATSQQQNSLRGEITVSVHSVQSNGIWKFAVKNGSPSTGAIVHSPERHGCAPMTFRTTTPSHRSVLPMRVSPMRVVAH